MQLGGRSPNAAVQILFGNIGCSTQWRTSRAALVLKLLNAPAGSWQHLAIIAHHHLNSPWFVDAMKDLKLVLPTVRLKLTMAFALPFLSSTGVWSDEGEWLSFHARSLPMNVNSLRYRPHNSHDQMHFRKAVKTHIKRITFMLKQHLQRDSWAKVHDAVVQTVAANESSKLCLLSTRLHHSGPPLHFSLASIPLPSHRQALASLLSGDWFLAVHAHNYFAKALSPKSATHMAQVQDGGAQAGTVCLSCWHFRRQVFKEIEYHVLCVCPEYSHARQQFLHSLEPNSA